jgi:hypothetical protein
LAEIFVLGGFSAKTAPAVSSAGAFLFAHNERAAGSLNKWKFQEKCRRWFWTGGGIESAFCDFRVRNYLLKLAMASASVG